MATPGSVDGASSAGSTGSARSSGPPSVMSPPVTTKRLRPLVGGPTRPPPRPDVTDSRSSSSPNSAQRSPWRVDPQQTADSSPKTPVAQGGSGLNTARFSCPAKVDNLVANGSMFSLGSLEAAPTPPAKLAMAVPRFLDHLGVVYDQYYRPLCDFNDLVKGSDTLKQMQFAYNDGRFRDVPKATDYTSFVKYEQAVLEWKDEIKRLLLFREGRMLVLPRILGRSFYRPAVQQYVEVNKSADDDIGESFEDDAQSSLALGSTSSLSGIVDTPGPGQSSTHSGAVQTLYAREEDADSSVEDSLRPDLVQVDRWDAVLLPAEPNPTDYDTYEEYAFAMLSWEKVLLRVADVVPPPARMLRSVLGLTDVASTNAASASALMRRVKENRNNGGTDGGDVDELTSSLDNALVRGYVRFSDLEDYEFHFPCQIPARLRLYSFEDERGVGISGGGGAAAGSGAAGSSGGAGARAQQIVLGNEWSRLDSANQAKIRSLFNAPLDFRIKNYCQVKSFSMPYMASMHGVGTPDPQEFVFAKEFDLSWRVPGAASCGSSSGDLHARNPGTVGSPAAGAATTTGSPLLQASTLSSATSGSSTAVPSAVPGGGADADGQMLRYRSGTVSARGDANSISADARGNQSQSYSEPLAPSVLNSADLLTALQRTDVHTLKAEKMGRVKDCSVESFGGRPVIFPLPVYDIAANLWSLRDFKSRQKFSARINRMDYCSIAHFVNYSFWDPGLSRYRPENPVMTDALLVLGLREKSLDYGVAVATPTPLRDPKLVQMTNFQLISLLLASPQCAIDSFTVFLEKPLSMVFPRQYSCAVDVFMDYWRLAPLQFLQNWAISPSLLTRGHLAQLMIGILQRPSGQSWMENLFYSKDLFSMYLICSLISAHLEVQHVDIMVPPSMEDLRLMVAHLGKYPGAYESILAIYRFYYFSLLSRCWRTYPLHFQRHPESTVIADGTRIEKHLLESLHAVASENLQTLTNGFILRGLCHRSSRICTFFLFLVQQLVSTTNPLLKTVLFGPSSGSVVSAIAALGASSKFRHSQFAVELIMDFLFTDKQLQEYLFLYYDDPNLAVSSLIYRSAANPSVGSSSAYVDKLFSIFRSSVQLCMDAGSLRSEFQFLFKMDFVDRLIATATSVQGPAAILSSARSSLRCAELLRWIVKCITRLDLLDASLSSSAVRSHPNGGYVLTLSAVQRLQSFLVDGIKSISAARKGAAVADAVALVTFNADTLGYFLRLPVVFSAHKNDASFYAFLYEMCRSPHASLSRAGWKLLYTSFAAHPTAADSFTGRERGFDRYVGILSTVQSIEPVVAGLHYLCKLLMLPVSEMQRLQIGRRPLRKPVGKDDSVKILEKESATLVNLFVSQHLFVKIHTLYSRFMTADDARFQPDVPYTVFVALARLYISIATAPHLSKFKKSLQKTPGYKLGLQHMEDYAGEQHAGTPPAVSNKG